MVKIILPLVVIAIVATAVVLVALTAPVSIDDLPWIAAIALVSAATAAGAIEVAKRVFLVRGIYHRRAMRRWLGSGLDVDAVYDAVESGERELPSRRQETDMVGEAIQDFLRLVGIGGQFSDRLGGPPRLAIREFRRSAELELFDLPISQFAAQLADAADRAVGAPAQHFELSAGVAMGRQRELLRLQRDFGLDGSLRNRRSIKDEPTELRAVRAEVFSIAQKRVQAFQISTSRGWRRIVSFATVLACSATSLLLAMALLPQAVGLALILSIVLCPPIAWFLRDVAAVVERWRG